MLNIPDLLSSISNDSQALLIDSQWQEITRVNKNMLCKLKYKYSTRVGLIQVKINNTKMKMETQCTTLYETNEIWN